MAEHLDEPETEADEALAKASPEAVSMALGRAGKAGKAFDAKAAAFLDEQTALIRLQTEHLHEQRELQTSRLRWGRFSDRMKALLQAVTALLGLAVVAAVAMVAWQAHEDRSLVIQAFSAPPSFVARGYSGQVLADDLMGRVSAIRALARGISLSEVAQVHTDQADAVKVDIPGAGVSLDDAERFLRRWLGRQVPVTGDLRDEGGGLVSINLHVAGADPITVKGPAADADQLLQAAAEKVFASFDPENDVLYLFVTNRRAESMAAAEHNALVSRTPLDLANAYSLWAFIDGDKRRGLSHALVSIRVAPWGAIGWREAGDASLRLGHDQAAVDFYRRDLQSRADDQLARQRGQYAWLMAHARDAISRETGNYGALDGEADGLTYTLADRYALRAQAAGALHDGGGFRQNIATATAAGPSGRFEGDLPLEARWVASSAAEDWPRVQADAQALVAYEEATKASAPSPDWAGASELLLATLYRPRLALAQAMTGDLASANALIAASPLDCYLCVRMRGRIAAAARDWTGAERWFAEAARQAPRLPLAYGEWGEMRLAKGDLAGAISRFDLAHRMGPHWADPLELWGETLMRKGDFADAAEKFEQADKEAPQWGRNHLRWGEALARLGQMDEAKVQWRAAAGLDLSAAERAELARARAHG